MTKDFGYGIVPANFAGWVIIFATVALMTLASYVLEVPVVAAVISTVAALCVVMTVLYFLGKRS